jgi:hypothetical protein
MAPAEALSGPSYNQRRKNHRAREIWLSLGEQ